jgi:hypothetical protein
VGTALNFPPVCFDVSGPDVYVGGNFTNAGGDPSADYFALWGSILRQIRLPLVLRNFP